MSRLSRRKFVERFSLGFLAVCGQTMLESCSRASAPGSTSNDVESIGAVGGLDETGPYDVVEDWFKQVHDGFLLYVDGVCAQTPDRIFVASFGERHVSPPGSPESPRVESRLIREHFLIVLDAGGRVIEEWPQVIDLTVHPHSVQISPYDPDRHVWIIDREGHQILKFTNDGRQVTMTLGEKGVPSDGRQHFNRPADMAFLPDGSFLVADGYTGTRIIKFDENGQFLTEWGSKGNSPGEFNLVHCVAVDSKGRVYAADRNNGRVQVFDENGSYLNAWPVRRPNHLWITEDQFLWLADGAANRFAKFDLSGKLLTYWGTQGTWPGAFNNPHKFSVDPEGNLYVVDFGNNRIQKFKPKTHAPPDRLIGQAHGIRT